MSAPAPPMHSPAALEVAAQLGLRPGRPNLEEFADTLTSLAKAAPLVDLSAAAQRLLAEPGVRGAQVIIRQTWGTAQGSDKQLVAVVQVTEASHIHQALAQRLVDRMVAAYPDADN